MKIQDVNVLTPDGRFVRGDVKTSGSVITDVEYSDCGDACGDLPYLLPGFIDMHFHGAAGYDFCDGSADAIREIAEYEASIGVTGICPATMTLGTEELLEILQNAARYAADADGRGASADLLGINMEGPFISPAKAGAQDASKIISCDPALAERFIKVSEGLVKIIGVAPDANPDAYAFILSLKNKVHLSLAHTDATYAQAMAAFGAGADHVVHLYNAMSPMSHREPGVPGAAADSPGVTAELICDGVHVHPAMVRNTLRLFGTERVIFISDSMRAAGLGDGRYKLGGLDVEVQGPEARLLSTGALAGSVTPLPDCVRTAVRQMRIPLGTAVLCATANPAKKLGVYDKYGSIEPGKTANLVLWDSGLNTLGVIKDGEGYNL